MPEALFGPAKNWNAKQRYSAAIEKHLDEGWAGTKAMAHFGVDTKTFYRNLKKERISRGLPATKGEEAVLKAHEVSPPAKEPPTPSKEIADTFFRDPLYKEERRVPPPDEFDRMYFGNTICPDCDVMHVSPPFHHEWRKVLNDPDIHRAVINVFPYSAKSTVCTTRDKVYKIVCNPNTRQIVVSESQGLAKNFLREIKGYLADDSLYDDQERNLIDDWGPFNTGNTWSTTEIIVEGHIASNKDPTVQALGVGNQIYGRRADEITFDDIATKSNQTNPDHIISMLTWIDKECLNRVGRKKGKVTWVGTKIMPLDIYYHLEQRAGYTVLRYPSITDHALQETLWPEHLGWTELELIRAEMTEADFELVYQNVDTLVSATAIHSDAIDGAMDIERTLGHQEVGWTVIGGIDIGGAGPSSGYTAFVVLAVDTATGKIYVIDAQRHKQMKAPEFKAKMFEMTAKYGVMVWRIESNGIQANVAIYNEEIVNHMAAMGVRVEPHITSGQNKYDPEFGVQAMAVPFNQGIVSIPHAGNSAEMAMAPMVEELKLYPYGNTTDLVMAFWFAWLGIRDHMKLAAAPLFHSRTSRYPSRIRNRRRIYSASSQSTRTIPIHDQHGLTAVRGAGRRMVVGEVVPHHLVREEEPKERPKYANREGEVPDAR